MQGQQGKHAQLEGVAAAVQQLHLLVLMLATPATSETRR
jgi:hypothetical protein